MISNEDQKKKLTIWQQLGRAILFVLVAIFVLGLLAPRKSVSPQTHFNKLQSLGLVPNGVTLQESVELGHERSRSEKEPQRP